MRKKHTVPTTAAAASLALLLLCCMLGGAPLGMVTFSVAFPVYQKYSSSPLRPKPKTTTRTTATRTTTPPLWAGMSDREREIRLQIAKLKREGKLNKSSSSSSSSSSTENSFSKGQKQATDNDYYQARIRQKLGGAKSKLMGYGSDNMEDDLDELTRIERELETEDDAEALEDLNQIAYKSRGRTGSAPESSSSLRPPIINPALFESDDDDDDEEEVSKLSEEDLVELVERKLLEKRARERQQEEERQTQLIATLKEQRQREEDEAREAAKRAVLEQQEHVTQGETSIEAATITTTKQITTGIGGSWSKNETAKTADLYQPKSGSWGAFPRPRDISKAYGGGRRVGPGYSDEQERLKSEEDTRERLRRYREKVGIDVPTEKEHAAEIEEALQIGQLAMQRGIYSTAVSALEKVTKYCSTNSKLGGKVFLELAMAYEAVGRTQEAVTVYRTLSNCRIEDIKYNAKRLLYGLEAMQFMRDEVGSKEFSRKRVKNTFIDTTGLGNIASYFDDVYNTAYIDLEGGFYKRLTQSVVRSAREARQILLRATNAGEVDRMRIVQALRSLSRRFDDALQAEISQSIAVEPIAVMNGMPIQAMTSGTTQPGTEDFAEQRGDEFVLADAKSMMENLDGEWRLQLLADKSGDGVKYFNSTLSWQEVDIQTKTFSSSGQSGFVTVQQTGEIEFNEKRRILRRRSIKVSRGGMLSGLFGGGITTGAAGAVSTPQQIISVDSILLVTRGVPSTRNNKGGGLSRSDDEKDYFAVWRRVEPGTFTKQQQQQEQARSY